VALVDNISHTGRVLLVTGQSVSSTEMAAGFLFFKGSAANVRRSPETPANEYLPNFEMILRVTEVNQIGDSADRWRREKFIREFVCIAVGRAERYRAEIAWMARV
jgi:hypothetical protein